MNRKMKIILTASIVLNVLLIGAGAGMAYKMWSRHSWHRAMQDLSPETRNLAGQVFQGAFRDIRPLGKDARKVREALVAVLSAEDFDGAAFDRVAARLQEITGQIKDRKIAATKSLAEQLPVEERRKMARRMAGMIGGRPHRDHHDERGRGAPHSSSSSE